MVMMGLQYRWLIVGSHELGVVATFEALLLAMAEALG